jgi:hypothetical protein
MPDRYGDHAITDYECFPARSPGEPRFQRARGRGHFGTDARRDCTIRLVRGLRTLDGKEQSPTAAIVFANGPACFAP